MAQTARRLAGSVGLWILLVILPCLGCGRMSERIADDSVGMNGGFEHAQSGLPVNWLVYSPRTIPTGKYELILDRDDFKEGEQSLRFLVHECSATGGWHSPGIAREDPAVPGGSYLISFWIKNDGCDYVVTAGGVAAKTADYEIVDSEIVGSSKDTRGAWRRVEYPITIPQEYENIRFELSVRSPGSLWIDDVRIARIDVDEGRI